MPPLPPPGDLGAPVPALAVELSSQPLTRVRAQALRTLGATGDTEHVEAVRDLLDDDQEDVRRQAARAREGRARRLDLVEGP